MPIQTDSTPGAPCWIELFTSDPDTTVPFYENLFGWKKITAAEKYGEADYGGYFNFTKDGHLIAGGMHNDGSMGMPDTWSLYLAATDAEATAAAAAAAGGQVYVPAMPVMDLGSMAILADTGGAAIGIWQPGRHRGFELIAEPGAPAWFELFTRDYDAALEFYRTVFDWDIHVMEDSPEFRYSTFGEGDAAKAGIMDAGVFLPEGVPAHWSVYFAVTDADATVATAVEGGGSIIAAAEDTPYGRLATLADPSGAQFKIMGTGAAA